MEGSPTDFGTNLTLAVEQMHELMRKHPDLKVIISVAGRPMRSGDGAWEAFAETYPKVVLLSADSLPEQLGLLNRGYANGLVGQQPVDMGARSIDTLLALSEKEDSVEEFVRTDMVSIVRVNKDIPYIGLSTPSTSGKRGKFVSLLLAGLALCLITE